MSNKYIVAIVLVFISNAIYVPESFGQPQRDVTVGKDGLTISCKIVHNRPNQIALAVQVKNTAKGPLLLAVKPRRRNGEAGYYLSLSKGDPASLEVASKVYKAPIPFPYADESMVELIELHPAGTFEDKINLGFPVRETMPPYGTIEYEERNGSIVAITEEPRYGSNVEYGKLKSVGVTFGYFEPIPEIMDYLKLKSFGWFVSGREKFLIEKRKTSFASVERTIGCGPLPL